MNSLFSILTRRFTSQQVRSVQSIRYKYAQFLNLEMKSNFHFLYLDNTIDLCRYTSRISIGSYGYTNFSVGLLKFMKEFVHAGQFLYVKQALQYMNGHAALYCMHKSCQLTQLACVL